MGGRGKALRPIAVIYYMAVVSNDLTKIIINPYSDTIRIDGCCARMTELALGNHLKS